MAAPTQNHPEAVLALCRQNENNALETNLICVSSGGWKEDYKIYARPEKAVSREPTLDLSSFEKAKKGKDFY